MNTWKETRKKLKKIYDNFYLEKQYKKILKRSDFSCAEKLDKMCDEFYGYLEDALSEVVDNDYRSVVLYGILNVGGLPCEEESSSKIRDKRVEQKTLEIASFFVECHATEQDLSKVQESTKNMFDISIALALNKIENYGFDTLKTKFIDVKKQELENQREQ